MHEVLESSGDWIIPIHPLIIDTDPDCPGGVLIDRIDLPLSDGCIGFRGMLPQFEVFPAGYDAVESTPVRPYPDDPRLILVERVDRIIR